MKVKELIIRLLEEDLNADVFVATTDESRKDKTSTEKNNVVFDIDEVENWGGNAYIGFTDWRTGEICDTKRRNQDLRRGEADESIKSLDQSICEDAVSRKAVINAISNNCLWISGDDWNKLVECIESIPSITSQLKMGHWVKTPKTVMGEGYMWYCDKCEHQVYQDSSRSYPSENYCPNCGAKMVVSQESAN